MIGSARQVEEAEGLYVCFNGGRSAHCIALLKLQAVSLHKVLLSACHSRKLG